MKRGWGKKRAISRGGKRATKKVVKGVPPPKKQDSAEHIRRLEELVNILSRGKYMWESTFDAISAPVQIVSADYEVLRANLGFAAVGLKDITKIIGKKCYEVFAGLTRPCMGCPLDTALRSHHQVASSLQEQVNLRDFDVSAYPLAGTGQPGAVVSYRDVTEEKRLQCEVIQQEKMAAIGMLAGGVAHEINNPLGGILAFVQLMKRDVKGSKALLQDLEEVEKAALRCKKIVADLLDFSRVSKERERCLLDINVLLEKVFPFIQRELRALNIELIFDGAASLPPVLGVPDRLEQVLLNLMTNACHAMPKGGRLSVTTESKDGIVDVSVRDTGSGIDPKILSRIFDPFFTTKEPGKGTGLGLSISYRIVKEHDGEIVCQNLKDGGTEFTLMLPIADKKTI